MPVTKTQILIAARARASGLSWKATAELVKRDPKTVRNWRDRHKAEWDRCYKAAQRETQDEAGAEAVGTLRNQLRLKDSKIAHMAAKALLVWFSRPMARIPEAPPADDTTRVKSHLQSLNPDEKNDIAQVVGAIEADTR